MKKYKAVILDVDGTLIFPSAQPKTTASPRVTKAIYNVQKKGIIVGLASGRSLSWVGGLVESLKLRGPLILDNGARIYDTTARKYIHESYLSQKTVKEVLSILIKYRHEISIVDLKEEERRFQYDVKQKKDLGHVVKIMVLHLKPQKAEKIYQILSKIDNLHVTKSVSKDKPLKESIHVTCKGATKGQSLLKASSIWGIELSQVIGIGDSYNDKDFLIKCGLKVAMGNAVSEIKAIADYIAPSYDQDGVAHVLEKFILESENL